MDKILWHEPNETVRFDLSESGPAADRFEPAVYVECNSDSNFFNRMQHYRRWCLSHGVEYRYLQIFTDNSAGAQKMYSRPIFIQPIGDDLVEVTMAPRTEHPNPSMQFTLVNNVVDAISEGLLVAETCSIPSGNSGITYSNRAFEDLCGYSKQELLGRNLDSFSGEKTENDAKQMLDTAQSAYGACVVEITQYRKDGSRYLSRVTQTALADETGWFTHYVSTHIDITVEAQEKTYKARQEKITRQMQILGKTGWWQLEMQNAKFEWSDGLYDIMDRDKDDSLDSADLLKEVIPPDQPVILNLLKQVTRKGEVATGEIRVLTKADNTKWLRIYVQPGEIVDGEIVSILGTAVDITDVVESERTREHQRDELEFYLECLDEYALLVKLDSKHRITYVNNNVCETLGYTRAELSFKRVDWLLPEEMEVETSFYECMKTGQTWRGEWVHETNSGGVVTLDAVASPRFNERGELAEIFIFQHDITLRKLSDQVSQVVTEIRTGRARTGRVLEFGLQRLVVISSSSFGVLRTSDRAIEWPLEGRRTGVSLRLEFDMDSRKSVTLELYGRPGGYNDEVQAILRPVLDAALEVERDRLMKRELKQHETENQFILETLKIGSFRRDVATGTWYFSDSLFELVQYPATLNGVVPQDFWDTRVPAPEQNKLRETMRRMFDHDEGTEITIRADVPNGMRSYIKIQSRMLRNRHGEPDQLVGIATDVTDEVRTQRELENQKSLASHQARLASIGELAAGVGHEINNPLAIIRGFLEIASNEMESGVSNLEDFPDLLVKLDDSAARIEKIVQGLRSLSHVDGKGQETFEPKAVLQDTVGFVDEIYRRQGIQFQMHSDVPDTAKLSGHEGKLQQVIMNLLSNAKDATEGQADRIILTLANINNEELVLRVQDNGPGVSASVRERVFHPFFTTKEIGRGTGIGLSMVFSIVQEFRGTVVCETSPMGGAEFIVRLPLFTGVTPQLSSKSQVKEVAPAVLNGRILVVDDETGVREFLTLLLGQMGLDVETASNGREALDKYFSSEKPIDLVITDLTMPEMGGLEFVDELQRRTKSLGNTVGTRVLVSTGLPDFSIDFARYPSVVGYLSKPFNLALMRKTLKDLGFGNQPEEADQSVSV